MNSVCVSVTEFFNEWVSRKAHIVMISVLVSTLLVVNIKTAEARLSELNDKIIASQSPILFGPMRKSILKSIFLKAQFAKPFKFYQSKLANKFPPVPLR